MQVNIVLPLACITTFLDGRGFAEHQFGGSLSVIRNACMVYLNQILHIYLFYHCPATGMQNGDKD